MYMLYIMATKRFHNSFDSFNADRRFEDHHFEDQLQYIKLRQTTHKPNAKQLISRTTFGQ